MNAFRRFLSCLVICFACFTFAQAQLQYFFWDFGCAENRKVDVVGKGLQGQGTTFELPIPDPSTVIEIAVEAVCKSNCPPSLTFSASQGATTVAAIVQQNGTAGPFGAAKSYRAVFRGSTDTVKMVAPPTGDFYSLVTYVFRANDGSRQQATMGRFLDNFYYRYGQTFTFNLPPANAPRDVKVTIPVSEMADDNRIARFIATAGSVTDTVTINTYDTLLGRSLTIVEIELENVPGNQSSLEVTLLSPPLPEDGDSFHAGIIVEAECPNRPPVALDDINNTLINTAVSGDVSTNDIEPDGDMSTSALLTGTSNGTLFFNSDGTYTYIPDSGYVGTDIFTYTLCEVAGDQLCDTAIVAIEIRSDDFGTNRPPIANNDIAYVDSSSSITGTVISNDFDPDQDSIQVNTTPISGPGNGTIALGADGSFLYTPNPGFVGVDTVVYELCEVRTSGTPLCDQATLLIYVGDNPNGVDNDPPFAGDDAFGTTPGTPVNGSLAPNDSDPNGDNLTYGGQAVDGPAHGTVTINPDGTFTYVPNAGYTGSDKFVYEVCDDGVPILCTQATAYITIFPETGCVKFDLAVFLEGALDPLTRTMETDLNTQGLLPGQFPTGLFAVPTAAGQPFNYAAFNYAGNEGDRFGDDVNQTPYPATVVDWVLVSLRTGSGLPSEEVFQQAALLHSDGSVEFVGRCYTPASPTTAYYIVVEHRNHTAVMSPSLITPAMVAGEMTITYDFRNQDGFVDFFSFGQKEMAVGTWAMFGADPNKIGFQRNEINGSDNAVWLLDNGLAQEYLLSDFNLDGEINGNDNSIWLINNGIVAAVPK